MIDKKYFNKIAGKFTGILLCFILIFLISFTAEAQVSQCIFNGTVQFNGTAPPSGTQVLLLGKNKNFIRVSNYQPSNGAFGVNAFSTDGLTNGDTVFFLIINGNDTVIAKTFGDPPVFNGNILPNPPNIVNLVLFYLATPVLITPANNSIDQPLDLTLSWNRVSGSSSYIFQLSKDKNFGSLLRYDSTLVNTSIDIKGLESLTKYYWRVKAKNSTGESDWSNVWSFTTLLLPPGQVVLFFPNNKSLNNPLQINFTWQKTLRADVYYLQLSTDSTFAKTFFADSTLTDTMKSVSGLQDWTKYFWRVKARNNSGSGLWSDTWSFTTLRLLPEQTTLSSPKNKSTDNPLRINFTWQKTLRADIYYLQLSTDSTFAKTFFADSTLTDTAKLINSLQDWTKYFWRVKAKNNAGSGLWSDIWSFATLRLLPDKPNLVSPLDSSSGNALNLNFQWNKANRADTYKLEISTDSMFSRFFYSDSSISDTAKLVTGLNEATNYFWRVQAINTAGKSSWSNTWFFTTLINFSGKPVLSFPLNQSKKNSIPTKFAWNKVDKAEVYHLEISNDSAFSKMFYSDTLIMDTLTSVRLLEDGTTYYWRILARNSIGRSPYSDTWKFATILPCPDSLKAVSSYPHKIRLTWLDRSKNESGFIIEKKVGEPSSSNQFKVIAAVKTNINSYVDSLELKDTTKYTYQVKAFNTIDSSEYSNYVIVTTLVRVDEPAIIPKHLMLYQNYPNPFNPSTTIQYDLAEESMVNFTIYNILGEKVDELINRIQSNGSYRLTWQAKNLATGVYFGRLNVLSLAAKKQVNMYIKMFLIK